VQTVHLLVRYVAVSGLVPHKACMVASLCASNFHQSRVAKYNASLFHSSNHSQRGQLNPLTTNNLLSEQNLLQAR
jgi:hypothetical protein